MGRYLYKSGKCVGEKTVGIGISSSTTYKNIIFKLANIKWTSFCWSYMDKKCVHLLPYIKWESRGRLFHICDGCSVRYRYDMNTYLVNVRENSMEIL